MEKRHTFQEKAKSRTQETSDIQPSVKSKSWLDQDKNNNSVDGPVALPSFQPHVMQRKSEGPPHFAFPLTQKKEEQKTEPPSRGQSSAVCLGHCNSQECRCIHPSQISSVLQNYHYLNFRKCCIIPGILELRKHFFAVKSEGTQCFFVWGFEHTKSGCHHFFFIQRFHF